uniref:BTB domain-containing protein n=1 Tax=Ditylenchus dipsaci TaxID=166011 RepID=A0A915CTP4_9BILA
MSNSWDRPVPSSLTGTVSKQATKVKIVSCKLEWRIDQFKKLMKFCKKRLVWELHVYPSGKREEDKGSILFFLRQVASQELRCPITADFQIYALTIAVEANSRFRMKRSPPFFMLMVLSLFSAKLNLCRPEQTDCQIQVGSTKFMAHKCVLGQKSQVFRAMFSQNKMDEAQSGHIDINDFPSEAIGAMLEFIYTGEISLAAMAYTAQEILAAADKYDVAGLKEHCESYLSSAVNAKNICELAVLADHYSASGLKEECARFIAVHYNSVIRMPEWNELKLSCSALVNELLESALDGRCLSSLKGGDVEECAKKKYKS